MITTHFDFSLIVQYVKEINFANPEGYSSFIAHSTPNVEVNINVEVRPTTKDYFETSLVIKFSAHSAKQGSPDEHPESVLNFLGYINYSAIIEIKYPELYSAEELSEELLAEREERIRITTMVEVPRLVFPFARQLVSLITQQGGFPPLVLNLIDFEEMYRQSQDDN